MTRPHTRKRRAPGACAVDVAGPGVALLAGTLPIEHLAGMRLIVTPGTIVRWHRDIVCRRWARLSRQSRPARRRAVLSGRWCCGWPGRTSRGVTAGSTASRPVGFQNCA